MALHHRQLALGFGLAGSVDSGALARALWLQPGDSFTGYCNWVAMIEWCRQRMENRAKVRILGSFEENLQKALHMLSCGQTIDEEGNTEPDASYQLLEQARTKGFTAEDWNWLSGDAVLAIVAEVSGIVVSPRKMMY